MRILLTGVTGYIGKRLLPALLEQGHTVVCILRDVNRFPFKESYRGKVILMEGDFLDENSIKQIPENIDVAYYLIHSMANTIGDFEKLELRAAKNFNSLVQKTNVKQVVFLTGITNANELSEHLHSRLKVEETLQQSNIPLTALRAGIIVGSGSASFEIIRDLAEKLPIMITPKWVNTRIQPIAVRNIIQYLILVAGDERTYHQAFDVGGPEVLTYKEMLLQYAHVRGLKRYIFTLPVMSPRFSSYWLYFITSTSYKLAVNLVNSMKVEVVGNTSKIQKLYAINLLTYKEAVALAFEKIEQNQVLSSWKDAYSSSSNNSNLEDYLEVPSYGCFKDIKSVIVKHPLSQVIQNIWSIGGERGWYYADWLWRIRGILDKAVGGIGLRRGRTNLNTIAAGDALDFWRVIRANPETGSLLLYAEMKLPGEAWLEFKIDTNKQNQHVLTQTATFRPKGLAGRLYWYALLPFHGFIFKNMLLNLEKYTTP